MNTSHRSLTVLALGAVLAIAWAPRAGAQAHEDHKAHENHGSHQGHRTFDDPAASSRSWDDPARDAWQRPADLVAALGVRPGMAAADIGTGTGYLLPHLSQAAGPEGRVFAVDVSVRMLEWVRARAAREKLLNVTTVTASGAATGLAEGSIDRAILVNVWHHVEQPGAYALDLFRSLREGGVLFVVEARPDAEQGPPRHMRMKPETVVFQLEKAGFRAKVDPFTIDRQYVIRAER